MDVFANVTVVVLYALAWVAIFAWYAPSRNQAQPDPEVERLKAVEHAKAEKFTALLIEAARERNVK